MRKVEELGVNGKENTLRVFKRGRNRMECPEEGAYWILEVQLSEET